MIPEILLLGSQVTLVFKNILAPSEVPSISQVHVSGDTEQGCIEILSCSWVVQWRVVSEELNVP